MIDFSELSILMVENNKHVRRIMQEMLQAFGVRKILQSPDALEAYSIMLAQQVDLVILDFFLGKFDGGDFTRMVRQDAACINRMTPILLCTGLPEHYRIAKARDAGINEILAKPVAPRDLYLRINAMLENPRPFVITEKYVGPCRRRRQKVDFPANLERRRHTEGTIIMPPRVWRRSGAA